MPTWILLLTSLTPILSLPLDFDEGILAKHRAIESAVDTRVHGWRCMQGDISGAEAVDFDDSGWDLVDVGYKWLQPDSICWFRKVIEIPQYIVGADVTGQHVRLKLGMDNEAEVFVDGKPAGKFAWWEGDVTLSESAEPGQQVVVAIRGINHPGFGSFLRVDLVCDRSEALVDAIKELLKYVDLVGAYMEPGEEAWLKAYTDAVKEVDVACLENAEYKKSLDSVERARQVLLTPTKRAADSLEISRNRLAKIKDNLEKAQALGLQAPYVRQKARVIESFLQYCQDDLAVGDTWKTIRGARNAFFIEQLSEQADTDIAKVLSAKQSEAEFRHYRTGPAPIADGVFTQQGKPIFFGGVGHFTQVRRDVPILNDYGFNMIQIEIGLTPVLPEPNVVKPDALDQSVLKVLDDAAEHNVAITLLISPHYFPQWVIDQHPAMGDCGYGFIHYCVNHPEARSLIERYLRVIMPRLKDHPALHSICLSNEPQFRDRCELGRGRFQDWLRERYSSVVDLNTSCNTVFSSFSDIPIPELEPFSPILYLWCRFNQEGFLEWHRWMADIIHEYDPDLPVHAKVMARAFEGPEEFLNGIDHELFAQLGTISGNDCWCYFTREGIDPLEYSQNWITQAMYYDFQRSAAPGQPILNSENHLIPDDDPRLTSAGHVYTEIWQGAMHGMGGHTIWVWSRNEGKTLGDNILTRAPCVEAAGRVGLDLLRCADEVTAFVRNPSEVAILYSWASIAPDRIHLDELKKVYEGLYFCGIPIRFVTERQCADGFLSKYEMVVVPRADYVNQSTVDSLVAYAKSGGKVILISPSLECDEMGHKRDASEDYFDCFTIIDIPMTARAYREVLNNFLEEENLVPPVIPKGLHDEALWGIRCETAKIEDGYLVNLVNFTWEPQWVRLDSDNGAREWVD
ncbi:MAG: beta-galactosidase, partial [bacterium]